MKKNIILTAVIGVLAVAILVISYDFPTGNDFNIVSAAESVEPSPIITISADLNSGNYRLASLNELTDPELLAQLSRDNAWLVSDNQMCFVGLASSLPMAHAFVRTGMILLSSVPLAEQPEPNEQFIGQWTALASGDTAGLAQVPRLGRHLYPLWALDHDISADLGVADLDNGAKLSCLPLKDKPIQPALSSINREHWLAASSEG